jgi:hypothetical protein
VYDAEYIVLERLKFVENGTLITISSPLRLVVILAVSATLSLISSSATSKEDIPESFFSKSTRVVESDKDAETEIMPTIPSIGFGDPVLSIDYFYSHNCEKCIGSSQEILRIIGQGIPVRFNFHPVSATAHEYRMAAIEAALF